MQAPPTQSPVKDESAEDSSSASFGWKVLLFNCDCHGFDEVERQVMKAIRCPLGRARAISWEAHTRGSSVIYGGPRERCEAVAAVLEEIRLAVKVCR